MQQKTILSVIIILLLVSWPLVQYLDANSVKGVDESYSFTSDIRENFSQPDGLQFKLDQYLNDTLPYTINEVSRIGGQRGIVTHKTVFKSYNEIVYVGLTLYGADGEYRTLSAPPSDQGYIDSLVTVGSDIIYSEKNSEGARFTGIGRDNIQLLSYCIPLVSESDLCLKKTEYKRQTRETHELVPVGTSECNEG